MVIPSVISSILCNQHSGLYQGCLNVLLFIELILTTATGYQAYPRPHFKCRDVNNVIVLYTPSYSEMSTLYVVQLTVMLLLSRIVYGCLYVTCILFKKRNNNQTLKLTH